MIAAFAEFLICNHWGGKIGRTEICGGKLLLQIKHIKYQKGRDFLWTM